MKSDLTLFEQRILLFSVFVLSLCGITYELVLGSLATYLLGNPVEQYSITIGFFLSSMGLGSFMSRYVIKDLLKNFILIEVMLGLLGGLSILILNFVFTYTASYYVLHIFFLVLIGGLVGLEIPLLTRILRKYGALKDILSNVLSLDYVGGLAGSLLFPLLLYPFVGRILTSLLIGIVNIAVAIVILVRIEYPGKKKYDLLLPILSIFLLVFLAVKSGTIENFLQKRLYQDDIVFSERSKFQQIVLTRSGNDFRLYLDGSLQFSTYDEYRYHEMLVFPPLYLLDQSSADVLVLGGGDGIAVRELLRSEKVNKITLVELDQKMISLAKNNSSLKMINRQALENGRVETVVTDAFDFLLVSKKKFDIIIADFPDPHDEVIAKLYTREFFRLMKRSLKTDGIFVTQSTSPLFARDAFWSINKTVRTSFKTVIPYHVFIPTFGDWGFNMATDRKIDVSKMKTEKIDFRFFSHQAFLNSLYFPPDSAEVDVAINTFNRPLLYRLYIKGWKNVDY